jgi:hypothetical protein
LRHQRKLSIIRQLPARLGVRLGQIARELQVRRRTVGRARGEKVSAVELAQDAVDRIERHDAKIKEEKQ